MLSATAERARRAVGIRWTAGTAAGLAAVVALAGCGVLSGGGGEAEPAAAEAAALFPPAGVDHLAMRVTVDVEIAGIGRDQVVLDGYVVVHRSGPSGADGKEMTGDLIGAALTGTSATFGPVVAVESPIQHSPCRYTCEGPGKYSGHFDIHGWFWLPKHGLGVFSEKPVRVRGVARAIPPVGQKAEIVEDEIALYSFDAATGNPIGALRRASGEVKAVVDLATHLKAADVSVPAMAKK
jgi:hypothetical protein